VLVKTDGIVLRQIPFSDTSIIVKIFTRDYGVRSFLIKGAKSKRNPKANILKPINQISISFNNRENKGLQQIKDCQLIFAPDAKDFGIFKSAVSMLIIEVLNRTIPDESYTDTDKFDFVQFSFQYLQHHPLHSCFYLSFLFQYAIFLGIEVPSNVIGDENIAENLTEYSYNSKLSISKSERKKIFNIIEEHFSRNLTNYKALKSIGILEEILQ